MSEMNEITKKAVDLFQSGQSVEQIAEVLSDKIEAKDKLRSVRMRLIKAGVKLQSEAETKNPTGERAADLVNQLNDLLGRECDDLARLNKSTLKLLITKIS